MMFILKLLSNLSPAARSEQDKAARSALKETTAENY